MRHTLGVVSQVYSLTIDCANGGSELRSVNRSQLGNILRQETFLTGLSFHLVEDLISSFKLVLHVWDGKFVENDSVDESEAMGDNISKVFEGENWSFFFLIFQLFEHVLDSEVVDLNASLPTDLSQRLGKLRL